MEIAWLVWEERFLKGCYSTDISCADASEICINAGKSQLSLQLKWEGSPLQSARWPKLAFSDAFNVV